VRAPDTFQNKVLKCWPIRRQLAERVKAPFLWRPCDHNRVI